MHEAILNEVCLKMASQVVGTRKLAGAPVAHERLVARVEAHVAVEMSLTREPLSALGAHVWLLVDPMRPFHMSSQLFWINKVLGADFTL
jgi:hypothetical protein